MELLITANILAMAVIVAAIAYLFYDKLRQRPQKVKLEASISGRELAFPGCSNPSPPPAPAPDPATMEIRVEIFYNGERYFEDWRPMSEKGLEKGKERIARAIKGESALAISQGDRDVIFTQPMLCHSLITIHRRELTA